MAFDANAANMLTLAFRENKTVSYPTFSGREDEDVDDFISNLEKALEWPIIGS